MLPRNAKFIIAISTLQIIIDLFFGTFLVSFIMHNSVNSVLAVAINNMAIYITVMVGCLMVTRWCKCHSKQSLYILSCIPKLILVAAILLLREKVVNHIVLLGFLWGVFSIMYYMPENTMISEVVPKHLMGRFTWYKRALQRFTKVVVPVILGFFISMQSYEQMAWVILFVLIVQTILALCMKRAPVSCDGCHTSIREFCRCAMQNSVVRRMFLAEIINGFSLSNVMGTVVTMYTVFIFQTDMKLGFLTTVFAFVAILQSYLFGRFITNRLFPKLLTVGALVSVASILLFVFYPIPATFLIYNFIYVIALEMINDIAIINMFGVSQSNNVKPEHQTEYIIVRETILNVGRWAAWLLVGYLGLFGGAALLKYYLIASVVAIFAVAFLNSQIAKKLYK